ncbi:hypothetical protein LTR97_002713 [Elasticomyces elasticus]|uniref:Heterokaryon incompatibility domain-containing protein n=1 Tax=Elasticomyces elasticus TaxID=574655 RepID=A0AAN7W9Y7_9PEZI|nr:hypothetical protein LTR97_002713 [Elasticomyces elasticus]
MRLINIDTLESAEFYDDLIPAYAILSHRWTTDELTYADFRKGRRKESIGYEKVLRLQEVTQRYNAWLQHGSSEAVVAEVRLKTEGAHKVKTLAEQPVRYMWLDTCCIDKRSSAELSEAINAMYSYYRNAQICFAHLADVHAAEIDGDHVPPAVERMMQESAWFSRGWTLQEMIAPGRILFCDDEWTFFAHKCRDMWLYEQKRQCNELPTTCHVNKILAEVTGVAPAVIDSERSGSSALEIFGWASRRTTSRVEDMAYCLLGLLGINMPLLYGEGPLAFRRLQEQIIINTSDESFFAFHSVQPYQPTAPILAKTLREFVCVSDWEPLPSHTAGLRPITSSTKILNNGTLQLRTWALRLHGPKNTHRKFWLVPVSIHVRAWDGKRTHFALVLECTMSGSSCRVSDARLPNNIYGYAVNLGQSTCTANEWHVCRWRQAWSHLKEVLWGERRRTFTIDLVPRNS